MQPTSKRVVLAVGVAGILFSITLSAEPGFGTIKKKKVTLEVRQPAAIRLANTSVAFAGSAASPAYSSIVEGLLTTLESELLSNEKTLVMKPRSEADWVLSLKVTGLTLAEPKRRTDTVGKSAVAYVRWVGSLRAAYQVLDHAGRSHSAGNVDYSYDKESMAGAGGKGLSLSRIRPPGFKKKAEEEAAPESVEDLKQILIHHVVNGIATKLGNTKHAVEVDVATGDEHLNRAAEFMENRLWARAQEELQNTPAYVKPESEAYRQYDLGLASEAISYEAKTFSDQKADILAAQEYYDKALESNRKEKYFVETVARLKDALATYKAFEGMQKEDQKARQTATPAAASVPAAGGAARKPAQKSQQKTLDAAGVIEMFSSGVPQAQILDIIQHSRVVYDPLDKDTAVAVAKAKLPQAIREALRNRAAAQTAAKPGAQPAQSTKKP